MRNPNRESPLNSSIDIDTKLLNQWLKLGLRISYFLFLSQSFYVKWPKATIDQINHEPRKYSLLLYCLLVLLLIFNIDRCICSSALGLVELVYHLWTSSPYNTTLALFHLHKLFLVRSVTTVIQRFVSIPDLLYQVQLKELSYSLHCYTHSVNFLIHLTKPTNYTPDSKITIIQHHL